MTLLEITQILEQDGFIGFTRLSHQCGEASFLFFFSKYVLLFYTFISVFSREITGNEATKVLRALDMVFQNI